MSGCERCSVRVLLRFVFYFLLIQLLCLRGSGLPASKMYSKANGGFFFPPPELGCVSVHPFRFVRWKFGAGLNSFVLRFPGWSTAAPRAQSYYCSTRKNLVSVAEENVTLTFFRGSYTSVKLKTASNSYVMRCEI